MPAYILTGTPGAGKTAVLRLLETLGYPVVEEAATDVIALRKAIGDEEPWRDPCFINEILALQRRRQAAAPAGAVVFFDRSPVCTLALNRHLRGPESQPLAREISRILAEGRYENTAFLIRNQGYVEPTSARRISYQDALAFERIHEQTYRELGFRLVEVPPGPLAERVALIERFLAGPDSR
jgi:predicted ATPase